MYQPVAISDQQIVVLVGHEMLLFPFLISRLNMLRGNREVSGWEERGQPRGPRKGTAGSYSLKFLVDSWSVVANGSEQCGQVGMREVVRTGI